MAAKSTWTHRKVTMQTNYSNAELQVDLELQARHLMNHCMPKGSAILEVSELGVIAVAPEKVTKEMIAESKFFCIPDRACPNAKLAVFLDGPTHRRRGARLRDQRVNKFLVAAGWYVLRCPFSNVSKRWVKQVVDTVEGFVRATIERPPKPCVVHFEGS